VLLRFFGDDEKEKLLLPQGRLTGAIKPSVGRLAWTTQSGHDHGGGIRGERISEGHGQILPQKKKHAMQKINLDNCPQCRQIICMSNTATLIQAANELATRRADCFGNDCFDSIGRGLVGSPQYRKAIEDSNAIPSYAEIDGVICESTICCKGHAAYFQNRFYCRKPDGYRGSFSLAKSIAKIG
jgi:hypothetical protein